MEITVIIPTYNPSITNLNKTLLALKQQTLPVTTWELIVIDNNSNSRFKEKIDLSWHKNSRVLFEKRQGLTFARIKGFLSAKSEIILMVDDDNILQKNYLVNTIAIFKENPKLGAAGGKSLPTFEIAPPNWLKEFYGNLALRDLGEYNIIADWANTYPHCAPIGAGMAVRKSALGSYLDKLKSGGSLLTDRSGTSLASGGDNDIILEIIKSGWQVGYFPSLVLEHIIPKNRMESNYIARLVNNTNKSWVALLESHNINPWSLISPWTIPLRKIKAFLTYKPWQSKIAYIKWRGACGTFDGLNKSFYK